MLFDLIRAVDVVTQTPKELAVPHRFAPAPLEADPGQR
jgi:hypothetical protein